MDDYIQLSALNDFIFCPYSIYLHSVYMGADEELCKAGPQARGKAAHGGVDQKSGSTNAGDLFSLPVYSDSLGVSGRLDLYRKDSCTLVERKFRLRQVFRGQLYQIWAEYFCLVEMGYEVRRIAFYETSTNKMMPLELPGEAEREELLALINRFKSYDPATDTEPQNPNKCAHCIYSALCDKTEADNVYA